MDSSICNGKRYGYSIKLSTIQYFLLHAMVFSQIIARYSTRFTLMQDAEPAVWMRREMQRERCSIKVLPDTLDVWAAIAIIEATTPFGMPSRSHLCRYKKSPLIIRRNVVADWSKINCHNLHVSAYTIAYNTKTEIGEAIAGLSATVHKYLFLSG